MNIPAWLSRKERATGGRLSTGLIAPLLSRVLDAAVGIVDRIGHVRAHLLFLLAERFRNALDVSIEAASHQTERAHNLLV